MNIGLDYDDTYTADKELWNTFIFQAIKRGHDVRFVTFRFERPNGYINDDILSDAAAIGIPVIFSNGRQKDDVTKELGYFVDIWIDDFPLGIPAGDHVIGMARGVQVNEFRRKSRADEEITKPVYSEEPLVIT